MNSDIDTIIAFPNANRPTEASSRRNRFLSQLPAQSDTHSELEMRADAQGLAEAIATRPRPRPLTAEEHASYVASVVGMAIRSAKRRGVRLESMLSIPRGRLLDLCEEGDPTCLLVRDWLTGARKHLPRDLEEIAVSLTPDHKGDA